MQYTADELRGKPTIFQGHSTDLKVDTGDVRVWLSRAPEDDPSHNLIVVEKLDERYNWVEVDQYDG